MKKWEAPVYLTLVVASILLLVYEFSGVTRPPTRLIARRESSPRTEAASSTDHFPPLAVSSPRDVRAVYLTAAVASVPSRVEGIIQLIHSTRLNAVVVNVKDGDGTYLGEGMARVVQKFRAEGIYPIARVVVFQDNALARARPDLALHDASGTLWVAAKAYLWVDPASREVWDRTVAVAERALDLGFREVNFDYVRFPSDGDTKGIVFPIYDGKHPASAVMSDFYRYLTDRIHKDRPGAVLSVDLFAYSFLINDGLGVGQRLPDAAAAFDVVSPMVYPSHYTSGDFGYPNPATEPYNVILKTLEAGKALLSASSTVIIRPWIQDFNLGAIYDAAMVEEEIRAVQDAGYGDTWMDWNPANIYDPVKFPLSS